MSKSKQDLRLLAEKYIEEAGRPISSWTLEEADFGTTILVRRADGQEMVCIIEEEDVSDEVVAVLRERGAHVIKFGWRPSQA